jgi:hypothetical protein
MIGAATCKAYRLVLILVFLTSIGMVSMVNYYTPKKQGVSLKKNIEEVSIVNYITTQEVRSTPKKQQDVQSTPKKQDGSLKIKIEKKATAPWNSTTPYFTLWNYTTHTINIPNKPPGALLTSLEILERVLVDNDVGNIYENMPSCLVPNKQTTQALVDSGETLQLPILNIGMPKCGSTTLGDFFKCAGLHSSHGQHGLCMQEAVLHGKPPIAGCKSTKKADALTQLDRNFGNCSFPQISLLDEIHQEHPHATFVMNFRPVDDWIHSARNWYGMVNRWSHCRLPGLIKKGEKLTSQEIRNWLCGHVKHVREFVEQYPTHKLIELDLYDTAGSSKVMSSLFNSNETCWMHSNARKAGNDTLG